MGEDGVGDGGEMQMVVQKMMPVVMREMIPERKNRYFRLLF